MQWLKPPTTVHKFRENGALSVDTSLAAPLATGTPTRTETGTKTEESTVENEKAKGEASFPAINRVSGCSVYGHVLLYSVEERAPAVNVRPQ